MDVTCTQRPVTSSICDLFVQHRNGIYDVAEKALNQEFNRLDVSATSQFISKHFTIHFEAEALALYLRIMGPRFAEATPDERPLARVGIVELIDLIAASMAKAMADEEGFHEDSVASIQMACKLVPGHSISRLSTAGLRFSEKLLDLASQHSSGSAVRRRFMAEATRHSLGVRKTSGREQAWKLLVQTRGQIPLATLRALIRYGNAPTLRHQLGDQAVLYAWGYIAEPAKPKPVILD